MKLQPKTIKILQTGFYFFVITLVGMFLSARGALLPNLAEQVNVGIGQIGAILTASAIGFMLANLLIGRFYDRIPAHRLMAMGAFITSILVILLPTANDLIWLIVIFLLIGTARGVLQLGANTLPLWLYGAKSATVMTALAGFFGAGSFLGPMLVSRVIERTEQTTWVFWVCSMGFLLMVPLAFLIPSPPIREKPVSNPKSVAAHTINENQHIIAMMSIFLMVYVGSEVGLASWITAFGITQLPTEEASRAYELASAFWLAMMIGRFISSLLSARISTEKLLMLNLAGMTASLLAVILIAGNWGLLFAGTIILGLSMASMFPLIFAWAEETLDVTGRISGRLFLGASIGSIIFPFVMGNLMENVNPISVMVMLLAMTLINIVIFGSLYLMIRRSKTKHQG